VDSGGGATTTPKKWDDISQDVINPGRLSPLLPVLIVPRAIVDAGRDFSAVANADRRIARFVIPNRKIAQKRTDR